MGQAHSKSRITFVNWVKALMLSPGILFSTGYLIIYFLTSAYLNSGVKNTILREVETATGNRYVCSVDYLRAGIDLHSVTLRNIELRPVSQRFQSENNSTVVSIPNLCVEPINLCNLLISHQSAQRSTREISRQILGVNERSNLFSANESNRTFPGD